MCLKIYRYSQSVLQWSVAVAKPLAYSCCYGIFRKAQYLWNSWIPVRPTALKRLDHTFRSWGNPPVSQSLTVGKVFNKSTREKQPVSLVVFQGKEVSQHVEQMAALRITVFAEYPYLYQGDLPTEMGYLKMYMENKGSIWILASVQDKIIGAIIGIPLRESTAEFQNPFVQQSINLNPIFCLGDIVVLKEHRTQGVGHKLYEAFENEVKRKGLYTRIAFWEVHRESSDERKPPDYFDLTSFWGKRGYQKHPHMVIPTPWKEIGRTHEINHDLVISTKTLKE